MSRPSSDSKSHGAAWLIVIIAVLVLYVATWPIVKIKGSSLVSTPTRGNRSGYLMVYPSWMNVLYRPLDSLSWINMESNPLHRYYEWWLRHLEPPSELVQ